MSKQTVESNKITATELHDILVMQVQGILGDPELASKLPPLLIHGAPGVGKSQIVKQVAEELGIGFIDVRLAEMDAVDIRGLPSVDNDKHSMTWNPPDFWPRDEKSKGILFLDEIVSCDRSIQVAAYELILDRKLGDLYHVPTGWYICAAGNRVEDRAVAMSMSSALANRFMHVELAEDCDSWVKWAINAGINPAVVGFIRYRPEMLHHMEGENLEYGWPSPRSWEKVSHMVDIMEKTNAKKTTVKKIVFGLVGPGAGAEFMEFYKNRAVYENILEMMLDENKPVVIPDKADQQYAMASALVYHLWRGKDEQEKVKRIDGFFRIVTKMPSNFATMAIMDAMSFNGAHKEVDGNAMKVLISHPRYLEWAKVHGKAMKKHL